MAISTYARDHGIQEEAFGEFIRTMHRIDGVFMEVDAEVRKSMQQQGGEAGQA